MIDFVIPCHPKDFPSLQLCVDGIRNISCANKVFVISYEDPDIEGIVHVDEKKFEKYISREKIHENLERYAPNLLIRTKWIYQQFLKLYSGKVIENLTDSYVLVDSDTIFLRDISFDTEKFYYCRAREYHEQYIHPIKKIFGIEETIGFSTICHHMIFNKKLMDELHENVKSRFDSDSFFDSVLSILDYTQASCMSEWDIYSNYIILNHPKKAENRQLFWEDIPFIPTKNQLEVFKTKYDFVSCHAYKRGIR